MAAPYSLILCHLGARQENKVLKRARPGASPSTAGCEVSKVRASRTRKREKNENGGRIRSKAIEEGEMQREGARQNGAVVKRNRARQGRDDTAKSKASTRLSLKSASKTLLSSETDQRSNCWSTPGSGRPARGSWLLCPRVQEQLEQFGFPAVSPAETTLPWEGPGVLMVTRISATFSKEVGEKNVPLGKGKRITAGSSWEKVGFELTLAESHPNTAAERAQHVQSY